MRYLLYILLLLPVSVFADSTFYISGTTDIDDNYISSGDPTYNYGVTTVLYLGNYIANYSILFRCPSMGDHIPAGWFVKSTRLEMYESGLAIQAGTAYAYPLVKPWAEGEEDDNERDPFDPAAATYNRWSEAFGALYEWGTAGANDEGTTWNEGDGTGDDRWGSNVGSVAQGVGWIYLDIDTAQVNHYIETESENEGWIVQATGLYGYYSSEYSTDTSKTLRVRMIIDSAAAGGPVDYRHGPGGAGQRHGPDGSSVRHGP